MKQNMRGGIDFVREQTDPSAQRQKSKVGCSPEAGRVRGKGRSLPLKYILRPLTMGEGGPIIPTNPLFFHFPG